MDRIHGMFPEYDVDLYAEYMAVVNRTYISYILDQGEVTAPKGVMERGGGTGMWCYRYIYTTILLRICATLHRFRG